MKKIIRILVILLIVAAAIAGIAWQLGENKSKIDANAQAAQVRNTSVLVTTTKPEKRSLAGNFELTGALKPYKELAVMSEVAGRVTQVNFQNGSTVNSGKVLLSVDNDLMRQQLEIAKVNLTKAIRDVERLTNLAASGGVPQQQLDDARNGVENLQTQVASLEKQVSMTLVVAPFQGTLTNKAVEPGAFVSPGVKLADLVQTSKLYLQVYALEDQLPALRVGQQAKVVMDLFANRPLTGRVTFIDVKADPSQRFLVEIELTNPGDLRAGMNGVATFEQPAAAPVLTLPRQCFVGSLREAKVYVVANGKAELRQIRTGKVSSQYVEIIDGLNEADQVVLTGQINLADGVDVTVQD